MNVPSIAAPQQQERNASPFLVLADTGDGKGKCSSAFNDFP
jgi:hypothetical protein